jgi:hypothetical protein
MNRADPDANPQNRIALRVGGTDLVIDQRLGGYQPVDEVGAV